MQVEASHWVLVLFIVGLAMISEMGCKSVSQETNPEALKILKQKSINPKTGLPKALDPNLFKGKAKEAYQIAREIPKIFAQESNIQRRN